MILLRLRRVISVSLLVLSGLSVARAQGAKKTAPETPIADADDDHVEQRSEWFLHGRVVPGKSSAELRPRAYQAKMQARAARLARAQSAHADFQPQSSSGTWTPLGPVPLASDATGDGFQNYNQVSGRATAVAIDPADPTGNTIYIGGAQGGVWKSTNAATSIANNVTWSAVTDNQATLSIGSIAIQPGNSNPANSVILIGTGEADNSADSYFGLGFLRSTDGGATWAPLISTANGGLSFSGLGAARMAFSTAQTNTVVAAMAASSEGVVDGALTSDTYRGLYTSADGGQTWTYNNLFPGGASEATSASSVVYNAAAGLFFAALRYHGFYSSPDGVTWTALQNQPGTAGLLNAAACPQTYVVTAQFIAAKLPSCRDGTRCTSGLYPWTRMATPWIRAFGRARTAEVPGRRSAIAASSLAPIPMAVAWSREPTTWNCWRFQIAPMAPRLAPATLPTFTLARSIFTSARSIPATQPASARHS